MTKIESENKTISKNHEIIYKFLENINNWENLMPERVTNWTSNKTSCNFTIQGTADLGMMIEEKFASKEIILKDFGKVPFPFKLIVSITEIDLSESSVQFAFNANLNPMLKLMAVNPLKNFLNMLVDKLNELEY